MKPILFNTEMVRAILDGRKTVTRRAIRPQPEGRPIRMTENSCYPGCYAIEGTPRVIRPPYQPVDILYVRETWAKDPFGDGYIYPTEIGGAGQKWRPSIHMPREAARLFLRVTGVRVERLKDIDGHGILKEGIDNGKSNPAMGRVGKICRAWLLPSFGTTPSSRRTGPPTAGEANPWVWVIEFERISKDEALGGGGDDCTDAH